MSESRRVPRRRVRRGTPVHTVLIGGVLLAAAPGCTTLGPLTVQLDRFNYNHVLGQSSNEQLLLNIVRLRYGEPVYWLEVSSMLSQYNFNVGANFGGWENNLNVWRNPALRAVFGVRTDPSSQDNWGVNLGYSDQPTISYAPLKGEEFAQRMLTPIAPLVILGLTKSGWSVDRVFQCCVQQLNDLRNRPTQDAPTSGPAEDTRFLRATALLRRIQEAGYLSFNLELEPGRHVLYLHVRPVPAEFQPEAQELRDLLGFTQPLDRIKLVFDSVRQAENELAIETRSLLGVMYALSQTFSPPEDQVRDGQAPTSPLAGAAGDQWLQIEHSRTPVLGAFTQAYFNGHWYYIRNSDWKSKRTFALLTYLFSSQASTDATGAPLITVPAGHR